MNSQPTNPGDGSYSNAASKPNEHLKDPIRPEDEKPSTPVVYNVPPRVVVKFKDNVELSGRVISATDILKRVSADAVGNAKGIELVPQFEDSKVKNLSERFRTIKVRNPDWQAPKIENYRNAEVRDIKQGLMLAKDLRTLDEVQYAYLHPGPVEPPDVNAVDDPYSSGQHYLDSAQQGGIDARYAWTVPGGDGKNQCLADVEWGWNVHHSDLPGELITETTRGFYRDIPHGTKVLGVIAAVDNTELCVGIAPNLKKIFAVGQWRSATMEVTEEAVLDAILVLDKGDVLLLEAQTNIFGHNNIPLEAEPAVFDMVWIASALDIVVVEAAGNGGVNLDTVQNHAGDFIFKRSVCDSGAIIVGSASPNSNPKWQRMNNSCFGDRVDCFASGSGVRTLSTNYDGNINDAWTDSFNLTSAASAIVAGAVLALQGATEAKYGRRCSTSAVRVLLSAPQLNTPSAYYEVDHIGVMPNLRRIINIFP